MAILYWMLIGQQSYDKLMLWEHPVWSQQPVP